MFDGDLIPGPVPTMFAEDPEVTKDVLKADIYRAHFDMAKLSVSSSSRSTWCWARPSRS
jgi:hypothetical protein